MMVTIDQLPLNISPNLMGNNGVMNLPPITEQLIIQPEPMLNNLSTQYPATKKQNSESDFNQPPPASFLIPDLSKPPPGFSMPAEITPEEEPMATPYFELPAGLMVPLIRLEDYKYKPLDPSSIKLPAPTPPNDRLLNAVDAFYAPPSHDRPRDGDGWEKLGLYEYYKVKNQAKKQKEEEIENGKRERSRSPSPIQLDLQKSKKVNKRRYRSKSRSRSRSKTPEAVVQRKPVQKRMYSRSPPVRAVSSPIIHKKAQSPPVRRERVERDRFKERERSLSPPSFV